MSKAYTGSSRRLVISLDVGTTFSGVSYCLLDPGKELKICNVTKYPGQEHVGGSSKVPTILCYDNHGNFRAAGAEALLDESINRVEDGEWIMVEWFKMRMCPASMPSAVQSSELPPLPPNKSLVQVFADFLGYLMACAEKFICDAHLTLSRSWDSLRDDIIFVMGHPNGWEGAQQSIMRQAAIMAKMVPDTPGGRSRVKFVTEGEASLHYCLREGSLENDKMGFVIADLGGGTLDFSAYKLSGVKPLRAEEICAVRCEPQGSTFVTSKARSFIKEKLRNSLYGSDEHIKHISARFDETTKKTFKDIKDVCVVQFGSISDKDLENGIRSGKLRLSGDEVALFFKPSVAASVAAIVDIVGESTVPITTVYLVGGFSAMSPALTDKHSAKAVADGAISFYLDQFVTSRVARLSYGIPIHCDYDPKNTEHIRHKKDFCIWPSVTADTSGLKALLQPMTSADGSPYWKIFFHFILMFGGTELSAQLSWNENGVEKRYPGQEHASGSSKIPTFLCYDLQGRLCAAGAEAFLPENLEKVEDEEWLRVEWNSWDTLNDSVIFVMGHPNGWEGTQQSMMRQAAIIAKRIPDTPEGHSRVTLVSEGEASLHYFLRELSLDDVNQGFVIADLGGGTLDFSAYKVIETKPLKVEEISAAKCEPQGSAFVTARAKAFFKVIRKLRNSRYGSDEHVNQISIRFDETTKKIFKDSKDVCVVPFGDEVAAFFKPSVAASVAEITDLVFESSTSFSADCLPRRIQISMFLVQMGKPKAVADEAILFYLENLVSSRVAKSSYGIIVGRSYDDTDPEHNKRKANMIVKPFRT
ncbi:hypothetical protein EW145_g2475 [Phellinidium pouzarii]|uniref:Uncharacterized protein n=1 Tax=Phellinidium pouzarii TaxID=167371 RepID=A0A4S4LAQ7_9AGAM|nr:hypothetical protein EW145_g2475 [Phellinidium pouzarii]